MRYTSRTHSVFLMLLVTLSSFWTHQTEPTFCESEDFENQNPQNWMLSISDRHALCDRAIQPVPDVLAILCLAKNEQYDTTIVALEPTILCGIDFGHVARKPAVDERQVVETTEFVRLAIDHKTTSTFLALDEAELLDAVVVETAFADKDFLVEAGQSKELLERIATHDDLLEEVSVSAFWRHQLRYTSQNSEEFDQGTPQTF